MVGLPEDWGYTVQPAAQDLTIYQGDTYDFFFRLRERVWDSGSETYVAGSYIDLTGYTNGKAQIRATPADSTVLAEFTVTLSNQSTIPGGVLLTLTASQTAALPTTGGVWDVQLTSPTAEIRTYIAGAVRVLPEVTRP